MSKPGDVSIPAEIWPDVCSILGRFCHVGKTGLSHAPDSLYLNQGQLKKANSELLRWMAQIGLLVALERRGEIYAFRLSDEWQEWALAEGESGEHELPPPIDPQQLQAAIAHYGPMGLRTLSHIALGDSHALDQRLDLVAGLPDIWVQPDAQVKGANLVRVAGLQASSPWGMYPNHWKRPGLFLWEWEIDQLKLLSMGQRLALIENPYPFWELMEKWAGQNVTLVCLHGETLGGHAIAGTALGRFLTLACAYTPGIETIIWRDPDPSGLVIACNAYRFVEELGAKPRFWMMGGDTLDRIEEIVLAERKLQSLSDKDRAMLEATVHPDLTPLHTAMRAREAKGEQEALVCLYERIGWL
jgi:hypothetical protein